MSTYHLEHLTGPDDQIVDGPIQDDEALVLYAVIRGLRIRRILEIGGLKGYSATNFSQALHGDGVVYTVDIVPIQPVSSNHRPIQKDARHLGAADVDGQVLDMIFFDCHDYDAQMTMFSNLRREGVVDKRTVLALHDTNVHPPQHVKGRYGRAVREGVIHQVDERRMVNELVGRYNYHAFCIHPRMSAHGPSFPFRHGLTLCQIFEPLEV
jgi:hypothetical protein